jgi:hypothetical protein
LAHSRYLTPDRQGVSLAGLCYLIRETHRPNFVFARIPPGNFYYETTVVLNGNSIPLEKSHFPVQEGAAGGDMVKGYIADI